MYNIGFFNKKDLNESNIEQILGAEVTAADDHYISYESKYILLGLLKSTGLEFPYFKLGDEEFYLELYFPEAVVASIYSSHFVLAFSYSEYRDPEKTHEEVERIADILLKNRFVGYNYDTKELIRSLDDLRGILSKYKAIADSMFVRDAIDFEAVKNEIKLIAHHISLQTKGVYGYLFGPNLTDPKDANDVMILIIHDNQHKEQIDIITNGFERLDHIYRLLVFTSEEQNELNYIALLNAEPIFSIGEVGTIYSSL
jgi:hypothetical protein